MNRALRSTIAFMAPLLLAMTGWLPVNAAFATLTAQNIAIVDSRGDYRFRVALLLAMSGVFVGAAALGTAVAHTLPAAILGTVLVCVCGSAWRHLSTDYGAGLAITSSFIFFYGLATPAHASEVASHSLATFVGAMWGLAIQVIAWPFRPQHPLRRTVADAWVAVADLFDVMRESFPGPEMRHGRVGEREAAVRTALDQAMEVLAATKPSAVRVNLETMNFYAARLAMRVTALDTALASLADNPELPWLRPTLEPLLTNLGNLARSVAVTIVSHQPGFLTTSEVRLRRASALLRAVRLRLGHQQNAATSQLEAILQQIEEHLPAIHDGLRATIRRANERGTFSLELRDLRVVALRPLASALNLTWRIDPALIRFTFRTAILTILGVIAYKRLHLPHGYWLPFTMVVVLQPDYGSTRRRAAQRMLGTLAGSIAATVILWLQLPMPIVMLACAATIFIFGYWIRRNYGVAVVFITLFVVLLTEATGPVSIDLAIERLGATLAGGLMALLAAQLFWPMWERERLPPLVATALRANRDYLRVLVARIAAGRGFDPEAREAKRRVERAHVAVFSSLNRLNGDPRNQREGLEHVATIANGNQRITRALNVLAVHLKDGAAWDDAALSRFAEIGDRGFELVANAVGSAPPSLRLIESMLADIESGRLPMPQSDAVSHRWAYNQLTQVATELSALLVAMEEAAPARS